ncbi:hypothetical protein PF005_g11182 [Phytophthora fragariae]|uniref:Uncharacterized protein n=1 Tax=Phytophthora fragariae TaxID=53985 RepID=A0A6A3DYQ3_9STRA|nr:hypothetical protein PF003_g1481 [Phytophthora fragariae]KAE8925443.1 hypothetical protein PF009_g24352 [Phytophthora fragariae]KAE9079218.1 hypothetical protein PF007_g23543 [Phytophthora fragariae]KAE9083884.1 hypothetical protein PF006_g26591 [Phytophthora fragariae]KAE9191033.1 hypothetical protein PF002_g24611 [Phytophthora fragariae]
MAQRYSFYHSGLRCALLAHSAFSILPTGLAFFSCGRSGRNPAGCGESRALRPTNTGQAAERDSYRDTEAGQTWSKSV